ncbi:hypothetical protein EDD18DRAFT_1109099 [Armillaria luteobubalina]|uniref:Uncharacterized protein n=1 Tax=Armillaria luteobubalina TaxID=153913 RepID=A0AA39PZ72_9AGAR|nr:hypothetical protein EDD18DRAFT_1109099 [Armillaria luteobubalina]
MDPRPPDISQDEKNMLFSVLYLNMNTMVLEALLHGLYIGIVPVTLWTIFYSYRRLQRTVMRIIIVTLYVLSTIPFVINWAFERSAFINHGNNYYYTFTVLWYNWRYKCASYLYDYYWRCWVLWDRQWRVLFIPIGCVVVGIGRNLESANYADIVAAYIKPIAPTLLVARVSAHGNTSLRQEQMVAMWEHHRPLDGCFGEECTNNSHLLDDGDQMVSGSSGKETVDGFMKIKILPSKD